MEERGRSIHLDGLRGAARAVVAARLVEAHGPRPALFLTATAKEGDRLLDDLQTALGEPTAELGGRVRLFPRHDTPPYDRFSPQPFVVAQRMDVLYRWLAALEGEGDEAAPIVVAPWTALAPRVPSRSTVRERSVRVSEGECVDRDALIATLVAGGYHRQPQVEERGELAVRGGIVDVFPPQRARPVRIELLGDQVETIREFDPASQRSEGRIAEVIAPPARELLLDRELVIERDAKIRELAAAHGMEARQIDGLIDSLLRRHVPPGAESMAPLLQPALETVFDFLPEDTLVVVEEIENGRERLNRFAKEAFENYDAARHAARPASPPQALLLSAEELEESVQRRKPVYVERIEWGGGGGERYTVRTTTHEELSQALVRTRAEEQALAPLVERLHRWRAARTRVVLAVPLLSGAERLAGVLANYGLAAEVVREPAPVWQWSAPGAIEIRVARLSSGFELPLERLIVVTEEEIFGRRERRRSHTSWRRDVASLGLADLSPGDPLVHAEHGIGIYRGLVMLDLVGASGEFLRLEYLDGDRLFVPVHRLNLVQRFVGADGAAPRIDKLGGRTWEKTKKSVRKSLRDMAHELLRVHAARELVPGRAFSPRDRHLEEFEASFPYEETEDQRSAIEDVLADLARDKPMDRLVCGDVGYGKTEVAIRAAFRVVMDGGQVAVLVPTTVLCQQHLETFTERFEGHPVEIESLSRFRTPAESKKVLEGLANGRIDVVIGTHRLLQKNVEFRNLGLLVVDEEHRFGVAHKERIKDLRKTVDVVTLTATPIPRTLQMAFSGLRDLSVINTPPADRLSIRTQVCRFDEALIRESILREVQRGGQVFFVHNRVATIGSILELLERTVPEALVMVAHGQMPERELEDRMLAFVRGKADVLLCTTIIESGLDIPRANTIIVDRSDALGLAQIYQLRGRVGRSDRRAYAYLLVPNRALTHDAKRRLEAIQDLSELGSGFRLATLDLEIRGAGNMLGAEQSGNLAAVGYDTYMEMLEEAIDDLRGKPHAVLVDPEIRLPVAARLPEAYVPEVNQRLVLYRRLAGAPDHEELERVRDEILDRYGPLPEEAERLLRVIRLKIRARDLGILSLEIVRGELVATASAHSRVDPELLMRLMGDGDSGVRVLPDQKVAARLEGAGPEALFSAAGGLLEKLAGA